MDSTAGTTWAAFFYGTLMHPAILKNVIKNDGSHLLACPGHLKEYTRHRIKNRDYPGILPCVLSQGLFQRDLEPQERCVEGIVISGLTAADLKLLDEFEGVAYARHRVEVQVLGPFVSLGQEFTLDDSLGFTSCEVYVWCAPIGYLCPELWSHETFVKRSLKHWI